MAKIVSKIAWWETVENAASYRVRVLPEGVAFDYDAVYVEMDAEQFAGETEAELNLALPFADLEGPHSVFVTAADGAGNESDPLTITGVLLDFTAPPAPAAGGIRS